MTLTVLDGATVPSDGLLLSAAALLEATGWELKPEGLCRGDACVPASLPEPVPLAEVAFLLGRPLAHHDLGDQLVAVLGEAAGTTVAAGETAPPLVLPDVDGAPVPLGAPGRKTAVVAWSTW